MICRFAAAALVSDILLVAKVLPPFESLATQGLPPPVIDGPLFQGLLRSALPRNLTRVLINRGLLHANMLVKHGCLRMLLEVLSAVEFHLNSISKARQSLQDKSSIGESSQISLGTSMGKKLKSFDASLDNDSFIFGTESIHDSMQSCSKELDCCQKWWALEEYLKNELRSFSPDPQVLFSLLSLKPVNIGSVSDVNKKGNSTEVLKSDKDLLERAGLLTNGAGGLCWDHADHREDPMASLVDIWNADSEIQAGDLEDFEGFLSAKLLEALAVYQVRYGLLVCLVNLHRSWCFCTCL